MQVLFVGFFSLFLSAPVLTQKLFRELKSQELIQVALDNAGILIAREDTTLLNRLSLFNKKISLLEKAHHGAHFCPEPHCKVLDKKIELEIKLLVEKMGIFIEQEWVKSLGKVNAYLNQRKVIFDLENRPQIAPIRKTFCGLCQLATGWETTFTDFSYFWKSIENEQITTKESIYVNKGRWEYALSP